MIHIIPMIPSLCPYTHMCCTMAGERPIGIGRERPVCLAVRGAMGEESLGKLLAAMSRAWSWTTLQQRKRPGSGASTCSPCTKQM